MNQETPTAEEILQNRSHEASRQSVEAIGEAAMIPCVKEALDRAEQLSHEDLSRAVEADKASSTSSWSAKDYAMQRLAAIRGLQQLIDFKKAAGKEAADLEESLRQEADRLARYLLTKNQWNEPEKEILAAK